MDPPVDLAPIWAAENRQRLFLYAHVPFCEMRCGFCNLFTSVQHEREPMQAYLRAFTRQHRQLLELVGEHQVASLAIGGGTPTQLPADLLADLLESLCSWQRHEQAPWSCETSPATADRERLSLLRQAGVTRVSMGVQSFVPEESAAVHRPQAPETLQRALETLRGLDFPILNLDLMVGLPGQTAASLELSLDAALAWQPEELYVYPLYVRPQTRLFREFQHDPAEVDLYRVAHEKLLGAGYQAVSRRMYRRASPRTPAFVSEGAAPPPGTPAQGLDYRCQRDGMLGLGCGARSYTRQLHYSSPYAVGSSAVGRILREYLETEDFRLARFGFRLDAEERRRRFAVLSLLSEEGLDPEEYCREFGTEAEADFPVLREITRRGWAERSLRWTLTGAGRERADQIGPLFFSPVVAEALACSPR